MKKLICILAILFIMTGTSACGDNHLEINCVFSGKTEGLEILSDLYEQEGIITFVSSLFPEIAAETEYGQASAIMRSPASLFSVSQSTVARVIHFFDRNIDSWTTGQETETRTGAFSGELFESASSLTTCEFLLKDFLRFTEEKNKDPESDGDSCAALIISLIAEQAYEIVSVYNPRIRYMDFDGGRYRTYLIEHNGQTVAALSADRPEEGERRLLLTYKEEGRFCFREIIIRTDETGTEIVSSLKTGRFSSFRKYKESQPLFRETLMIISSDEAGTSFEYEFEPCHLDEPLTVKGLFTPDSLHASAFIGGNESDRLDLSAWNETLNRKVSFSDKTILRTNDKKENAELMNHQFTGLMRLASEILYTLPYGYQKLLVGLFE